MPDMKPAHHVLDVYDTCLHAAFDMKTWRKLARTHDFLPKKPAGSGNTSSALWVPKVGVAIHHVALYVDVAAIGNDTPELANTCAHEATHAAGRILEHVHQPLAVDEAYAYLVGWITGWLMEEAEKAAR